MFAGLGKDAEAASYVLERLGADGIVSASPGVVQKAVSLGRWGILRVFVHDSQSMESGRQLMVKATPSAVELMPGLVVGHVLSSFAPAGSPPVIAAGLIKTPEQAAELLGQGVTGIDTSAARLWRWGWRSLQSDRGTALATAAAVSCREGLAKF
jgi:glycerol uptake operon antiterminator